MNNLVKYTEFMHKNKTLKGTVSEIACLIYRVRKLVENGDKKTKMRKFGAKKALYVDFWGKQEPNNGPR